MAPRFRLSSRRQQSQSQLQSPSGTYRSPSKPVRFNAFLLLATILLIASLVQLAAAASSSSDKCAASSNFECPNCGGIDVSDCAACEGYQFADYKHGICYDRKLFSAASHEEADHDYHYPFLWHDLVGSIVWFFTAGLATACGVGGGGIYVPMGIILLRFPPKPASGLSQASIFGASLGGLMVNIRNIHPLKFVRDSKGTSAEKGLSSGEVELDRKKYLEGGDGKHRFYTRPVIDYDMALFLAPMEMAGAVLGVIIQKLFPNWLFLSLAAIILGFTSLKTYKKFFATYAKEKLNNNNVEKTVEAKAGEAEATTEATTTINGDAEQKKEPSDENGTAEIETAKEPTMTNEEEQPIDKEDPDVLRLRRKFLEEDERQYPKEKLAYLVLMWVGLTVITFLKGGKGVESIIGVTCEDAGFYVLIATQFFWTMGFAAAFGYKCMKRTEERKAVDYPFNEWDPIWDFQKVRFYAFFTFVAGVVAGLIGIGGGMVLGPLMLVMGIHPQVSTATTATMIVMTSSSVAIIFVLSGLVPWQYAVFFFSVCLLGAIFGKLKIDAYVKRTGMTSVLIGVLATIIAFATVGCIVIMLLNLNQADWCVDGFKEFCAVSKKGGCEVLRRLAGYEMFPY